jgi:hypothetical protein
MTSTDRSKILGVAIIMLGFTMMIGCGGASSGTTSSQSSGSGGTNAGNNVTSHSVDLSWNASTSQVVGYNIYRGSQSGGPYAMINPVLQASTTYVDNSVQGGQTYYYVVTSVDSGSHESTFSNEAQAAVR